MGKKVSLATPKVKEVTKKQRDETKVDAAEVTDVNRSQTDVSQAVKASDNLAQGDASSMTATTQDMGEKADASYQANKIMGESSPLMRLAKQKGLLTAAASGLGNSSIAAGASQAAMSAAAVPLAQQNAKQQQTQELANQDVTNKADMFNTGETNDMETTNVAEANRLTGIDATEQNDMQSEFDTLQGKFDAQDAAEANLSSRQKHSTDSTINQTWLSGKITADLAQLNGGYQQLISTSQAAQGMFGSATAALGDIWSSDIPLSQKNTNAKAIIRDLKNGYQMIASINKMDFG